MLLMFMLVGVLGLGFNSSAKTYVDWEGNPKTLEKLDNPYVDELGHQVVYKKLKIASIEIEPTSKYGSGGQYRGDDVIAYVERGSVTDEVDSTEWRMVDVSTGEVVKTGGCYVKSNNKYAWDRGLFECMPKKFVGTYYLQVRFTVSTQWDSASDDTYSEWSDKYYFITQPKMVKKKKGDIKSKSIKVRWQKIKGATSYTVYAKKWGTKKWYKAGTTKNSTFKITKLNKKKINGKKPYRVKVIANAKYEGKTIKSTCNSASNLSSYEY